MDTRHYLLEIAATVAVVIATAFVATFVVSLINAVCR
jgi:hypothetical protein